MAQIIAKEDLGYPELLKHIGDPPEKLYYKGAWKGALFEHCLAVVGSRRMTTYGRRATERIVGEVASAGVTIVSGFMFGVDEAAHKAAVEAGSAFPQGSGETRGKTIAVMPCGIERVHPEYQKELYYRILKTEGLIVSEYEGNCMPQYWMYPKRNRIVAGLSQATLVVEAGLNSGSLITADFAKKFGRKVFAVPGPITSEVSKGTLKLLKEGASIAGDASDILEFFEKKSKFKQDCLNLDFEQNSLEQKILKALQRESLEADMLARTLRVPVGELGTVLSLLELQGIVKQEGGKYYAH